jgi:hypothetical protein
LLTRRSQLTLASRGVDLLQKKRDALMREFVSLVHETTEARKWLYVAAREAHRALLLAKSFDGPEAVDAFSQGVPVLSEVEAAETHGGVASARRGESGGRRGTDGCSARGVSGAFPGLGPGCEHRVTIASHG